LQAFDQLMQRRPAEAPDSRLLVVTVTEADIQAQKNEPRRGSLSDRSLAQLLEKLESYQPRVIGLDIYRDFPVGTKYPDLAKRLKQSKHLIAVCKVSNPETNDKGVSPPPEVSAERLGFSDVVTDPDGVLRRHLLALTPDPASPCTASYALSTHVAFQYLAAQGISPKFNTDGYLQLGNTVFKPLEPRTGGYQNIDAWGHQVLLNYRFYRSPQNFARQVTLTQVLKGQLNPDAVKDRIVLIGVSAASAKDYFFTPYSTDRTFNQQMPGVVVQAQMVSQIVSACFGSATAFVGLACMGGSPVDLGLVALWRFALLALSIITTLGAGSRNTLHFIRALLWSFNPGGLGAARPVSAGIGVYWWQRCCLSCPPNPTAGVYIALKS
jgi:CHASE2 domain-containing sensor protein